MTDGTKILAPGSKTENGSTEDEKAMMVATDVGKYIE
jgi:hypothetical protein